MDVTNIDEVGSFLEHSGMTDEMIDTFFEHHGVKGMKWGQRKLGYQRVIAARRTKTSNQLSRESQGTNRRLATVGVAALGVGAAFAAKRFAKKSPKMSAVYAISAASALAANSLIRAHQKKKMSEISFAKRSAP